MIHAPAWFTQSLPTFSLDGELWMGRGSFERLSAVVRTLQPDDAAWRNVRYVVFDMPISDDSSPDASSLTFEQRWALLKARLGAFAGSSQPSWLQLSTQDRVASLAALKAHLHEVTSNGAEGLVLHRWSAHWMPGRSSAVKKLKLQPDAEAIVVGHLPGKGKYKGQLGALTMQMPTGQGFVLGSGFSDAQRALPPSIGRIVTYRFRGHTAAGIPKFASFLRVREIE